MQAPSAEERGLRRGVGRLAEQDLPVFFGIVEQAVEIDVVHQRYSDHGRQPGAAPLPRQPFLHHHQQQVSYQRHPYLYLDRIGALAVEVFQREVLLHLFEQQLDYSSFAVNGLKNRLRASLVGISQCAAPYFESYAEVRQLVRLGKQRRCYLS